MSAFVDQIRELVNVGAVITSDHARGRLQEKSISYRQLVNSLESAQILERYPEYWHGPCFLARHTMADGKIAHAVWGMRRDSEKLAVLVTAYWPDSREWDAEFRTRQ